MKLGDPKPQIPQGIGQKDSGVAKEIEGMTDAERANSFWETWLRGETRIERLQNPECEFAIVVPAYNEKPERILKQIESLRSQNGINPSQFEIIYVVGNDLPTDDPKLTTAIAANQELIKAIQNCGHQNVFVIDKSSPGNEMRGSNIGKARNRGIAEAGLRFYEGGKNGTLIQTDADTYFEDPEYLSRLRTILKERPDVIAIAGGIVFEFSPDTTDEKEIAELREKTETVFLMQKWDMLTQFLNNPDYPYHVNATAFSGANMITKSYESAIVGGLVDTNVGETTGFHLKLETYGAKKGQKVIEAKNELVVITALRESDRTGASFKRDFDRIDLDKPFMVSDPFASETLSEFRDRMKAILGNSALDQSELRKLLTNEEGSLMVSEDSLDALLNHINDHGMNEGDTFLAEWVTENFGRGFNLTQKLFDAHHPQIPLTEESYQKLLDKVSQHPKGTEFIKNLNTYFRSIRLPSSNAN